MDHLSFSLTQRKERKEKFKEAITKTALLQVHVIENLKVHFTIAGFQPENKWEPPMPTKQMRIKIE